MSKVYILINNEGYDGTTVEGVFDTFEQAKKVADILNDDDDYTCDNVFEVMPFEMNSVSSELKRYFTNRITHCKNYISNMESLL